MSQDLAEYVAEASFPCVMAKAAFSKGFVMHEEVQIDDPKLAADLIIDSFYRFVDLFQCQPDRLSSYNISFNHPKFLDFEVFNEFFFKFLDQLNQLDKKQYSHDPRVSAKPSSGKFSFSVKGEAFFLLVLHPQSPRLARQFHTPTVIFNAHQQFEDLRDKNIFEKVRDLIRGRDKKLQGYINPMLTNYGEKSEVFQYTGKIYAKESKCPFKKLHSLF